MQNLCFECHYIGNSNANHTSLHDVKCLFHVWSQGFLETTISRHPFCQRMCCVYLTNIRFQWSFTTIYPWKQTNKINPTWCKLQHGWITMQPAVIHSRIRHVYNVHVGCYAFPFDFQLSIYSSGLPTSFCYDHLITSTPANHGSTNTSARCEWIRIELNDGCFIQYATCWGPTTMQTPRSPRQRCECSLWKYHPGPTG